MQAGPRGAAARHKGWQWEADMGFGNRMMGVLVPGSAVPLAASATSEPVHPVLRPLAEKGGTLLTSHCNHAK